MNRSRHLFPLFLLAIFSLSLVPSLGAASSVGDATLLGARAAAADSDATIAQMLRYAIEDEYLARAEYAVIMAKFGALRPFSNIIKAEESHIAYLREAFADASLALPADFAASRVSAPATLLAAFQAGKQAEIDNIAMYDGFLASPLLARADAAELRALFVRLRDASKNHLRSFDNQLSRY
ncbi:MAG: hypothetical protein Q8M76_06270 [Spirochaetaceae bacterium]|nr:hypothetical protein [Spirochaetaceae bacterium]